MKRDRATEENMACACDGNLMSLSAWWSNGPPWNFWFKATCHVDVLGTRFSSHHGSILDCNLNCHSLIHWIVTESAFCLAIISLSFSPWIGSFSSPSSYQLNSVTIQWWWREECMSFFKISEQQSDCSRRDAVCRWCQSVRIKSVWTTAKTQRSSNQRWAQGSLWHNMKHTKC